VDFDPAAVEQIELASLPKRWRSYPAPRKLQDFGDAWVVRGEKPVLRVPSAIVPAESNYLLNPAHPDFERRLHVSGPIHYRFDSRLA
jgi:RES domain-containing protein